MKWAYSTVGFIRRVAFAFPLKFILNVNKTIPREKLQEHIDQLNRRIDLGDGKFFEARVTNYLSVEELNPAWDYYGKVGLELHEHGCEEAR